MGKIRMLHLRQAQVCKVGQHISLVANMLDVLRANDALFLKNLACIKFACDLVPDKSDNSKGTFSEHFELSEILELKLFSLSQSTLASL